MTRPVFTEIEQEAIVLAAALDLIDDMVNFEIFEHPTTDRATNLWFKSSSHKRVFAILLGDFLSQPQARGDRPPPFGLTRAAHNDPGSQKTYLRYLAAIGSRPQIGKDAQALAKATEAFSVWLDADLTCEGVWLSGLDIEFDMTISRILMLQIIADMSKHNFSRLEGRIQHLRNLLAQHGHQVDEGSLYLELPVFEEWLYTHLFSYHASTIAEFLNEIRLTIYAYLQPEFARSYRREPRGRFEEFYTFDAPDGLQAGVAHGMYWRLMNAMRHGPWFPPFSVDPALKLRY
ncbi:hypothetical protein ASD79_06675 [Caulobacter sp. Root655]|uniref:hypothetical protein n=1 Tax=Caulobacter sp. Root655 TaxID=1736578 RepID=UPI0007005724|nr:hypothetical protein [Caulobacter sp. Root655]KRA61788.1 hypothetical protein ASD79_06675 [Caulobacter sp. Root655]